MEKILTVSVAAYNVEKYLRNTLSTLADSRYVDKLEVFVVDDGGKDQSLAIAKEFEEKYPGTFHAVHKENGGYGSTVNYSIQHAAGEFFKLLDGDDWMNRDGLNEVLNRLPDCKEDAVVTDYLSGPDEEHLEVVPCRREDGDVVSVKEYETSYPHGMWSLFYRISVLKASGVVLPEHTLYTDQIYSTVPFAKIDSIRFYKVPVYCYRFGREEQSTSRNSRIKHADEMLRVCRELFAFYEKNGTGNQYLLSRVSRYYAVAVKTLLLFPVNRKNRDRIKKYEQNMKVRYPEIYKKAVDNNLMGKFIRLMRRTSYCSYWLLKLLPGKYLG